MVFMGRAFDRTSHTEGMDGDGGMSNLSFDNLYQEKRARANVNDKIGFVGRMYHDSLASALHIIDHYLLEEGFTGLSDGIYCGDGRVHEQVGPHTYISLTYHRMESGRYEIVAYLS